MEDIRIEGTPKTPTVNFTSSTGTLDIKGRSIPENSIEFYKPLMDWIEQYAKSAQPKTTVNIQLEYFNTSSSKCILDLFKKLEAVNNEIVINWYYEEDDEDMLEAGEDYDAIINIPFRMIEIEEI
ncbi:MAG: DUF1987 domain-containing protein [Flavobacteriales bacterium]|jgi:hypothetical protein